MAIECVKRQSFLEKNNEIDLVTTAFWSFRVFKECIDFPSMNF